MANVTATVKMLNTKYIGTHVRVSREWNEVQVRLATDKDYSNGTMFDLGHTSVDKVTALEDAEDYCRDIERRASIYIRMTETY